MGIFASIARIAACAAAFAGIGNAAAQEYPSKPIRLIVPFAAGGAPDVVARNLAQRLSQRVKQPVVVENRLGAGGNIAYEAVARSAPDGYTMVLATTGVATNVSLYKQLSYDAIKDFAPITMVSRSPHVVVTQPSLPVNTIQDLIALARAKPGQLSYGSAGSGTILHLAGEMLSIKTGVKLMHVPYRGGTLALNDLMGGSIQLMFSDIASAVPQIKAGKLRAIAVTGAQRTLSLPDVPTVAEGGVPGYAIEAWFGLLAPAGTPAPVINRLNREFTAILAEQDFKDKMLDLGLELAGSSPEEFGSFVRGEVTKMGDIVKASGASLN
jgi:tripartite-type tricarboxylate transporter receptor subunit TctC